MTHAFSGLRNVTALLCVLHSSIFLILYAPTVSAETSASKDFTSFRLSSFETKKKSNWIARFLSDNTRSSFDAAERIEALRSKDSIGFSHDIGLDFQKIVSGNQGDLGTFLMQAYISRQDNIGFGHAHGDSENEWYLSYHDINFNYTGLGNGDTGIRVGKFNVPFGLEPNVDTHFQLKQYLAIETLGFKKDWGISINSSKQNYEYEISVTRGSGNDFRRIRRSHMSDARSAKENWALAGRIGTPAANNFFHGLSLFYGEIPKMSHSDMSHEEMSMDGHIVSLPGHMTDAAPISVIERRTRVGYDLSWVEGPLTLLTEISYGQNFDLDIANAIFEVDWQSLDSYLVLYSQFKYNGEELMNGSWERTTWANAGLKWQVGRRVTLSVQYDREIKSQDHSKERVLQTQLRLSF